MCARGEETQASFHPETPQGRRVPPSLLQPPSPACYPALVAGRGCHIPPGPGLLPAADVHDGISVHGVTLGRARWAGGQPRGSRRQRRLFYALFFTTTDLLNVEGK